MRKMIFNLIVSATEYERYYQGDARAVVVTAEDGRTLRFPANALQRFVTHDGVAGRFEIEFDEMNKMTSIERVGVKK